MTVSGSKMAGRLHPRIQAVVTDTGVLTPFFFKWLVALWERTGGFDDAITPSVNNEYGFTSNFLLNDDQVAEIEQALVLQRALPGPQEFISRNISSDYTVSPFELVSMSVKGTISLPAFPNNNDKVKLFNKNGKRIKLSGNGNLIDGETSITTIKKNTLLCVEYFVEIGEWIIV